MLLTVICLIIWSTFIESYLIGSFTERRCLILPTKIFYQYINLSTIVLPMTIPEINTLVSPTLKMTKDLPLNQHFNGIKNASIKWIKVAKFVQFYPLFMLNLSWDIIIIISLDIRIGFGVFRRKKGCKLIKPHCTFPPAGISITESTKFCLKRLQTL